MISGVIEFLFELGLFYRKEKIMEIWQTVRIILSILSFLGVIGIGFAGWWAFRKVTTNDLKHINEDLKELKVDVKTNRDSIVSIDKSLVAIATKLEIK